MIRAAYIRQRRLSQRVTRRGRRFPDRSPIPRAAAREGRPFPIDDLESIWRMETTLRKLKYGLRLHNTIERILRAS